MSLSGIRKHVVLPAGVAFQILHFAVSPAYAQSSESNATSSAVGLEEIVVTAQRRSQNLQDVPIAVTTFTAAALQAIGVESTDQLLAVTPGLTFQRQLSGAVPYIRGVGTQSVQAGTEAAVATYVDGVYYGSPFANIFSFNNIQQIEVLKGPQGTLFGRNATGGLIQVITRDPQSDPTFRSSVSYGNYQTIDASAYASAGTDKFAFDLAGQLTHQGEGYGHNLLTGSDVNYRREEGVRSKILWTPDDGWRVTISGDYSRLRSDLGIILRPLPGTLSIIGAPPAGSRYDTNANFPQSNETNYYGGSVKIEYALGWATLSALSAYRHMESNIQFDQDATPVRIVDAGLFSRDRSFQEEILLQGNRSIVNYTAGLFYYNALSGVAPLTVRSVSPAANFDIYGDEGTRSYAAFAQADYSVTASTALTAGIRYTVDKRDYHGEFTFPGGDPSKPADTFVRAVGDKTFPKLTWRFAVDQKLEQDVSVYLSYSRGFKGGLFSATVPSNPPVKPETLDALEGGLKSEFFDRTLRINVSGFYYIYNDIQLNKVTVGGSELLNAAKGHLFGAEAETSYFMHVGRGNLTLNLNTAWLHAKYSSFPNGPVFTPTGVGGNAETAGNLSGNTMIRSPKWTGSISGQYQVPLENRNSLQLSANYFRSSSFFWEPDNRITQPSYGLLSAQAAISFHDDRFKIKVFGRNLTNSAYFTFAEESAFGDQGAYADPRTYGAGFEVNF